jgi:hypothetical protein
VTGSHSTEQASRLMKMPRKHHDYSFVIPIVCALGLVSGCGGEREYPASDPSTVDDVFDWQPSLILEELGDALVASPTLRRDPSGGWLYWDPMVPQVRRYADNGTLIEAMGRAGEGPGEFQQAVAFMRDASGRLVSVDQGGRVATWSDSGELLQEFSTGVAPVAGAVPFGDHVLIVAGFGVIHHPEAPAWLHLVDMDSQRVVQTSPAPEIRREYAEAAMAVGGQQARTFGESVHVGLATADTVWSWRGDLRRGPHLMPVPSESLGGNQVPPPTAPNFGPFRAWFEEAWFLGDFVQLPDSRWLFQIWTSRGGESLGRLLLTDAHGAALWEVDGRFRILDVDPEGQIYLWDPAGTNPAEILVARLS